MAASRAFVNDTIILIDISWPVPTTVQWNYPPEAVVVNSNSDYSLIKFLVAGQYPVSIAATLGNCESSYVHNLRIDERPPDGGRKPTAEDFKIISMVAYPNPFEQLIRLQIDLNSAADIDVSVYHLVSNKILFTTHLDSQQAYSLDLDFGNREAGIYVVVASVNGNTKRLRLIKR